MKDVAKLAGCSTMTVSRVINNLEVVRPATRAAVHAAMEALHYLPNRAARNLAGATQIRVCMVYDDPDSSYLCALLLGCCEEMNRSDISFMAKHVASRENFEAALEAVIHSGVEGIILPPPICDDRAVLDYLRGKDVNIVLMGSADPDPEFSAVLVDEYRASYAMTRHIIDQGYARIGFIVGDPAESASGKRLAGYRGAMEDAGLDVDERMIAQGMFTYQSGIEAARQLIGQPDRPQAIFASNDEMAAAAIAVALQHGLDVPRDLAVCGFDDAPIASAMWPGLTTIKQPVQEMAVKAMQLLVGRTVALRSGKKSCITHHVFPYILVQRQSDCRLAQAASS